MTYEEILERMLDRVAADVDKREGSIFMTRLLLARRNWLSFTLGWISF